MTTEKIIEKLSKLKAHAESAKAIGNEEEAQAFAAMLQNLLYKHKLQMTDIEYAAHLAEEPVEEFYAGGGTMPVSPNSRKRVYKNYPDVEAKARRTEWAQTLASIIADAHACRILVISGSSQIIWVGHKSNTEVCDYLFFTMYRALEKLSWKEYCNYYYARQDEGCVEAARGFRSAFRQGFIHRLAQRFRDEKKKMEHDSTGTALVRIDKEAIAVKQYLDDKRKNKQLKSSAALSRNLRIHKDGYKRGQQVADSVNINANAVKSGKPNQQLN